MRTNGGGLSRGAAEGVSEEASPRGEERDGRDTDRSDGQVAGGV